ncbi:MAG: hypothetical protein KKH98_07510, partial [Spirochaetes bacterium]|nr:hypothetical protein [Spirochaetota bacterium]
LSDVPDNLASEEEINIDELNDGPEIPVVGVPSATAVSGKNVDIDKESLKTVLKYLDSLLDSLPEDKIKEFADSEYYDLYNKLINSLEI